MKFEREYLQLPGEDELQRLVDQLNYQLEQLEEVLQKVSVEDNLSAEWVEMEIVGGAEPWLLTPQKVAAADVKGVFLSQLLDSGFGAIGTWTDSTVAWTLTAAGTQIQIDEVSGLTGGVTYNARLLLMV